MEKEKTSSGSILDWKILRRILRFVRPYRWAFYFLILLTLCIGILTPVRARLVQLILDNYVKADQHRALIQMVIILFVLLTTQALVQYWQTYLSGMIGQSVIRDIRIQLYEHLLHFRLPFFDKTPVGRLVTRTISDVESLSSVFSQGLATMASDFLQIAFILGFMLYDNWRLALISLSTLPLIFLATYVFKEKIKVAFNETRNAVANLNTFVQEHITGMTVVQLFGAEKIEFEKFKKINAEHRNANLRSVFYYSIYFPVAEIIFAMGTGLLIWYGAKQIIRVEETGITVGTLTAFIIYLQLFFRPIRMIADSFNTLQMGIVSSSRIIQLLDEKEQSTPQGNLTLDSVKGYVSFENVSFSYHPDNPILKNINIEARPGEVIALVGATGAGKSSIVHLLNRFYAVESGRITIDGHPIEDFTLANLRRHIGMVSQDIFLFSESIRQNITLGNPEISDAMIWEAAALIGAKKFIERLPGQLDYNVMERGATLSVGQRQLLSFMRAMAYNPTILILDEATSSVDAETEQMIRKATEQMMKNRTTFVIAHRLSTVQKSSKIIVLDHGEIKEQGLHAELLLKNNWYARLYRLQFDVGSHARA